jgi:hypothetical protein
MASPKGLQRAAPWLMQPYGEAGKSTTHMALHPLTSQRENMSNENRKDYIKAVQCLRDLPSKSDKSWAPAAKTRFDDFVAIHVNLTMSIHGNGLFLTWHRYFVFAYERALRDECGYQGYQPVSLDPFDCMPVPKYLPACHVLVLELVRPRR